MPTSRSWTIALKGIGVALFFWIFLRLDASAVLRAVGEAPPLHLLLFLALFPPIYLLKSYRWHVLVRSAGVEETFKVSNRVYLAGLYLGILTPGKIGEAAKIPALRRRGLTWTRSMSLVLLDRALDAAFLAAIGLLGLWRILGLRWALYGGAAAIAAAAMLPLFGGVRYAAIARAELRLLLKHPARLLLLTAANWAVYFLQLAVLADGFGVVLPPLDFVSVMTLVGILSILPIAPGGLGTREAALLFFLRPAGFPAERIVAFSIAIFALTLLSAAGGIFMLRTPDRNATQ